MTKNLFLLRIDYCLSRRSVRESFALSIISNEQTQSIKIGPQSPNCNLGLNNFYMYTCRHEKFWWAIMYELDLVVKIDILFLTNIK